MREEFDERVSFVKRGWGKLVANCIEVGGLWHHQRAAVDEGNGKARSCSVSS